MKNTKLLQTGLLALFVFLNINLRAQQTPYFGMNLYFEDAIGNRDTVFFGYDIDATNELEAEWGEYEMTEPFDSVFDVRIGEFADNRAFLTDHLVSETGMFINDTTCFDGSIAKVYIRSQYNPVKIWWDKEALLDNECFRWSSIINHVEHRLAGPLPPDEIAPVYYCMAAVDTAYFEMTPEALSYEHVRITIEKEVEGLGIQTIYGLELAILPTGTYSPCYWVTEVNDVVRIDEVSLYPNPATNEIIPQMPDQEEIREVLIVSMLGQQIWKSTTVNFHEPIDVAHLSKGMYQLVLKTSKGKMYIGSFVKK